MSISSPVTGRQTGAPASAQAKRTLPAAHGFWVVGLMFATAMAFSSAPAPPYAVGVVGSLFLAGHTSDWLGRRRLLLAALSAEAVAAVVFLVWTALPGLIVARVISGIGVGLLTTTATAHLSELHAAARPGAGRIRADRVAVVANMGGLALGPLIAGAFAQ